MSLVHMALFDVESDAEARLDQWYREEHFPEIVRRPGWVRARRYECINGYPRFLTLYDLDDGADLDGTPMPAPFRAAPFIRRGIRNYFARTFRLIHSTGQHFDAPALINVITVEVASEGAGAFNRWYSDVHLPEILDCPGWLAGRRYECIDGDSLFLAIYDLEDEMRPFSTPQYDAAVGWDDHVQNIRGYHGFRIYRLLAANDATGGASSMGAEKLRPSDPETR